MMEELVDRFTVQTEHGDTVMLYVYQDIIPAGTFDNPKATVRGLMRVVDEKGRHVNVLDENGQYEIVSLRLKATGRAIRAAH